MKDYKQTAKNILHKLKPKSVSDAVLSAAMIAAVGYTALNTERVNYAVTKAYENALRKTSYAITQGVFDAANQRFRTSESSFNDNISGLAEQGIENALVKYSEDKTMEFLNKIKMTYDEKEIGLVANSLSDLFAKKRKEISDSLGVINDGLAYKIGDRIKKGFGSDNVSNLSDSMQSSKYSGTTKMSISYYKSGTSYPQISFYPADDTVRSLYDSRVLRTGSCGKSNYIVTDIGNSQALSYLHVSPLVKTGDLVRKGGVLGTVETSNKSAKHVSLKYASKK